jgi:hypothetical protein
VETKAQWGISANGGRVKREDGEQGKIRGEVNRVGAKIEDGRSQEPPTGVPFVCKPNARELSPERQRDLLAFQLDLVSAQMMRKEIADVRIPQLGGTRCAMRRLSSFSVFVTVNSVTFFVQPRLAGVGVATTEEQSRQLRSKALSLKGRMHEGAGCEWGAKWWAVAAGAAGIRGTQATQQSFLTHSIHHQNPFRSFDGHGPMAVAVHTNSDGRFFPTYKRSDHKDGGSAQAPPTSSTRIDQLTSFDSPL